jgi:hypothetical protein
MNFPRFSKIATIAGCLALYLPAAVAQNSILLLGNSLVEPTANTTSPTNPYEF